MVWLVRDCALQLQLKRIDDNIKRSWWGSTGNESDNTRDRLQAKVKLLFAAMYSKKNGPFLVLDCCKSSSSDKYCAFQSCLQGCWKLQRRMMMLVLRWNGAAPICLRLESTLKARLPFLLKSNRYCSKLFPRSADFLTKYLRISEGGTENMWGFTGFVHVLL